MGRRGPLWAAAFLAAVTLAVCSCGSTRRAAVADPAAIAKAPNAPARSAEQLQQRLAATQQRIEQLEWRLAAQQNDLVRARQEAHDLRAQEQAARSELQELRAQIGERGVPTAAWAAYTSGREASVETETPVRSTDTNTSLVSSLTEQLSRERRERERLERDLEQLREETSSGPFESRVQGDLEEAQRQVEELKDALRTERKARQDLARSYERLQTELDRERQQRSVASAAAPAEELAALEARQRRVLASIERDLLLSRQRESELRDALEASQGPGAPGLATTVAGLRAENDALQARLEDEHRRNRELSAKLTLATRVTELIFKMRSGATEAAAPSH
jgi:chromosome segregation ATPase